MKEKCKCKRCMDCNKSEIDYEDEDDVLCYCGNEKSTHHGEHRYYQDEACNDFVPYPRGEQLFCKYVPYAYLTFLATMIFLIFVFGR